MIITCQMCGRKLATIKPKNGDLVLVHEKQVEGWTIKLKGDKKNRELVIDPAACSDCFWGISKEVALKAVNAIADDSLDQFSKTKSFLKKIREGI